MNVELLNEVIEVIAKNPAKKTHMGQWCGTAHCIGGHAAVIAGWLKPRAQNVYQVKSWNVPVEKDPHNLAHVTADEEYGIEKPLLAVLGLTPAQGNRLFLTANWPKGFREAYEKASGPWSEDECYPWASHDNPNYNPEMAKQIVIDRIKHFIRVKGKR